MKNKISLIDIDQTYPKAVQGQLPTDG